jgi:hypothetical protein
MGRSCARHVRHRSRRVATDGGIGVRTRRSEAALPNEEMQLTKPDGLLVGGRSDHVRCRRAIVFESGLAADLRCSADVGAMVRETR